MGFIQAKAYECKALEAWQSSASGKTLRKTQVVDFYHNTV